MTQRLTLLITGLRQPLITGWGNSYYWKSALILLQFLSNESRSLVHSCNDWKYDRDAVESHSKPELYRNRMVDAIYRKIIVDRIEARQHKINTFSLLS